MAALPLEKVEELLCETTYEDAAHKPDIFQDRTIVLWQICCLLVGYQLKVK